MIVIFVHGWSVRDTSTYGGLPQWLANLGNLGTIKVQVGNVYLGRYISFDDTVTLDDLARAFDQAIRDELADKLKAGERVACITHSTGGPVVRKWMDLYYKGRLQNCPMSHLIMLAPANHGSALAQLGKSRLSRIKHFFQGVEPGQRVLDWLELGSNDGWKLNESWLDYDCLAAGIFPFVLTGQKIDRSLYDALNSYTDEAGSDGVVRVAAANMNYSLLRLQQEGELLLSDKIRRSRPMALGVLPGRSHSGENIGIIRSVTLNNAGQHPTAQWVLECLKVGSRAAYHRLAKQLERVTAETQVQEHIEKERALIGTRTYVTNRYSMVLFSIIDDRGNDLSDYDLYFTAGPNFDENELPKGFFVDRQRNQRNAGKLTYYLDYDVLSEGLNKPRMEGKLGIRLQARPVASDKALVFYRKLDFRSSLATVDKLLVPNETVMVEIKLQRQVDSSVFRMTNNLRPGPFDGTPSKKPVA
ncbi:MAG TPA: phospholipase [Verrucomicrobiae bacterium]|nr:phospholipase [Verrucomicrobiae bacterium]